MNNTVITYLSNIFKHIDVPEKDVQLYAEKMFVITLDNTLAEVATAEQISQFKELIKKNDEQGMNSLLLSLPSDKLQPVFIVKLQDNLNSFLAAIADGYNEVERADLIQKLEKLASAESLNQFKGMAPDEFLKGISK